MVRNRPKGLVWLVDRILKYHICARVFLGKTILIQFMELGSTKRAVESPETLSRIFPAKKLNVVDRKY